jgi:23S rRNA maturation mini-RNase III
MNSTFTLEDLANPNNDMPSTLVLSISLKARDGKSFSMPPFLYYAVKAKLLSRLNCKSEEQAMKDRNINIKDEAIRLIRNRASNFFSQVRLKNIDVSKYASSHIQAQILGDILNDIKEDDYSEIMKRPAISLCVTRAKKNVTVQPFLMDRLSDYFQLERNARRFIHELTVQVKSELEQNNALDEKRKILGIAGNSSWSRKVQNKAFLHLIKNSDIKELHKKQSILNVELNRDRKLEIDK